MNSRCLLLHAVSALLLACAAAGPARAQLPSVESRELSRSVVVRGDFDGDGDQDIAVVDRATGNYHLLVQSSTSGFSRSGPYATGISDVTGAAAGRVESSLYDSLVATSSTGNRVVCVRAIPVSGTSPVPHALVLPSTLGPSTLAIAEVNGTSLLFQDLVVGSEYNGGPSTARITLESVGAGYAVALESTRHSTTGQMSDATRVMLKGTLDHTASMVSRAGTGATYRVVAAGIVGTPTALTLAAQPAGAEFAMAPFGGAALGTLFRWVPGSATLAIHALSEPVANSFSAGAPVSVTLPNPIASVTIVPASAAENHLLITFGDGTLVQTYSFAAPATLTLLSTHALPAGEAAFGAIGVPGYSGFHLLTGDVASGVITRSRVHRWNGKAFAETQVVDGLSFKELGGLTNVFVFTQNPFLHPGATLLARLSARDWTSGIPSSPPSNILVQAETFNGGTAGLGGPTLLNLGAFPPGAGYTLLSQYRNNISVFGLSKPGGADQGDVSITPEPGTYDHTVQLDFNAPAGFTVHYRFSSSAAWTTFVDPGTQPSAQSDPGYALWLTRSLPLMLYKATTVEYYAQSATSKTPIHVASYSFSVAPDALSSLGDGVPDYVKIGRGYNPFLQPPNADDPNDQQQSGDPQSYLQKVLYDAGHRIDNRNTTPGAYTLYARPMAPDGETNQTYPSLVADSPPTLLDGSRNPGNTLSARTFSGGVLEAAPVAVHSPPFAEASSRFTRLSSDQAAGIFVLSTSPNYPLGTVPPPPPASSCVGREMIAVIPAPAVARVPYARTIGPNSAAVEANTWIAGAAAYYAGSTPPVVAKTLEVLDTGVALVFESWLQRRFVARGVLPPRYDPAAITYNPAHHLTITPYRSNEAAVALPSPSSAASGVVAVGFGEVAGLEGYATFADSGYHLSAVLSLLDTTLRNSNDSRVDALRRVVADVYRISAFYGNTYPGAFDAPVDALRTFMLTGSLPIAYTQSNPQLTPAGWGISPATFTSLTSFHYVSAYSGVAYLRSLVTARPVGDFDLVVRADTAGDTCTVLDGFSLGGSFALFRTDGARFRFPDSFDLVPGTHVSVRAYLDSTLDACVGTPLEVIEVDGIPSTRVTILPLASVADADGNLLGDAWELAFFGALGQDPWADLAHDGYTTLQKYLEGADPFVPSSYNSRPAVVLKLPEVTVSPGGVAGTVVLGITWPTAYFAGMSFRVQTNTDVSASAGWTDVATSFVGAGDDRYQAAVPFAGGNRYWRVLVALP